MLAVPKENLAIPLQAVVHHTRMSLVPLHPSETPTLETTAPWSAVHQASVPEAPRVVCPAPRSSLPKVRYNIVGKSTQFRESVPSQRSYMPTFSVTLAAHHSHKFLLRLAHALMEFGAPMHKIDEQLVTAANFLDVNAHFVLLNTVIIIVFEEPDGAPSKTHFVQRSQGLSLSQLQKTHAVYTEVIHDEISAFEGIARLKEITERPTSYSGLIKVSLAFLAGFAICPMGFSGSSLDALIAGFLSAGLTFIQILGNRDVLFVGIFEYATLIFQFV